mmetsp:Transcript_22792/g.78035  ORF Transcript_22792/g.78035 Transcript_22792/m.78035 type:complete len:282 (+) Transcript_22792:878-1723(+)
MPHHLGGLRQTRLLLEGRHFVNGLCGQVAQRLALAGVRGEAFARLDSKVARRLCVLPLLERRARSGEAVPRLCVLRFRLDGVAAVRLCIAVVFEQDGTLRAVEQQRRANRRRHKVAQLRVGGAAQRQAVRVLLGSLAVPFVPLRFHCRRKVLVPALLGFDGECGRRVVAVAQQEQRFEHGRVHCSGVVAEQRRVDVDVVAVADAAQKRVALGPRLEAVQQVRHLTLLFAKERLERRQVHIRRRRAVADDRRGGGHRGVRRRTSGGHATLAWGVRALKAARP